MSNSPILVSTMDPSGSASSVSTSSRAQRWRWLLTPSAVKRLLVLFLMLGLGAIWVYLAMLRMPGTSYRGVLPPLSAEQQKLAEELRYHVTVLAKQIGPRNLLFSEELQAARTYIQDDLTAAGLAVERQQVHAAGQDFTNSWTDIEGHQKRRELVVVGAHYDTFETSPGANDNGSGVAAALVLAGRLAQTSLPRTVRFAFFVNEEPPFFATDQMGSRRFARRCRRQNELIVAMLSLETIGYFTDEPRTQNYPPPFGLLYPSRGNFIAFVGNYGSRRLVRKAIGLFRSSASFPSEGAALPGWVSGIGWSDHSSFWRERYPGIMVTDTAPFRYPHYHRSTDQPSKLDYARMARVLGGLEAVIHGLATEN